MWYQHQRKKRGREKTRVRKFLGTRDKYRITKSQNTTIQI